MPEPFSPGRSVTYLGQLYTLIAIRDHTRLDGRQTYLCDWETKCPTCGIGFIASTSFFRPPRRRCDQCKRPGKLVRPAPLAKISLDPHA